MTEETCPPAHYGSQGDPMPKKAKYHYVEFNGSSSYIDCGSGASLDNIPTSGDFTVDLWMRVHSLPTGEYAISKGDIADAFQGWCLQVNNLGPLFFVITPTVQTTTIETIAWNTWYHIAIAFRATGDRKAYAAIDGTWCTYAFQAAGGGVYDDDSSYSLRMAIDSFAVGGWLDGEIQWLRISNNIRWTPGVDFAPPDMCSPPAVDANTIELWAMDEGTGVVTAASVTTPANDGAMTDCVWHRCIP